MPKGLSQSDIGAYDTGVIMIDPAPPLDDTTPDPFGWPSQTGWGLDEVTTSVEIVPVGYNAPSLVSMDVGVVSINGDPFSSTPRNIIPGQHITCRHVSGSGDSETVVMTVAIGGVQGTFSTTTAASPAPPPQGEIFRDDFTGGDLSNWTGSGSACSWRSNEGPGGKPCVGIDYDGQNSGPYVMNKNILSENVREIYVRSVFKFDANANGGSKFMKVFGDVPGSGNYANTTFISTYGACKLDRVNYGDGRSTVNDTQNNLRFDGINVTDEEVVVENTGNLLDPRDGQWHSYEGHVRFNLPGQRDGVYEVWIDDILRLRATNVKNTHDSNSGIINRVYFGDYTTNPGDPWTLRFSECVISTERIGSGT